MAQATAICGQSILACGLRVTLLDDEGDVSATSNNYYMTDDLISIAINPNIEEGSDRVSKSGCDCIIATAKFPNLLKRFDFEINLGSFEPALESLMTGAPVRLDESDDPVPIGLDFPTQVSCNDAPPPKVAIEVWSDNWESDHPSPTLPFLHWVWPGTRWNIGPSTLNSDFAPWVLNGFSFGNSLWGHGPFTDAPAQVIGPLGSVFQSADAIPDAECGFQSVTPAS